MKMILSSGGRKENNDTNDFHSVRKENKDFS